MNWENKVYTKVYDKNDNLLDSFIDKNMVVNQGVEVARDCLIYENKSEMSVIAYWKLDDNTPTTNVIDETNNYNGTCSVNTNTIYSSEGRDGGCQDKANTVYTEVGSATDFLYQEFSISLWVKFDSVSGTPTLFGGQDVGNWQYGYAMRLIGGVFKFHTNHWSSGQALTSTTTPIVDTWYHCTFVVNDNGTNRMYINGIEEASASYSIIAHSGQTKIIGNSTDRDAGHGLDGKIDNVHFMNKALSQSEITVLYNNYDFRFNGLRNIKLSTNATGPQLTDTSIGGTEYSCGRQSNESETNLEPDMSFGTTTLEHDTLNIPFKYTNNTGGEVDLRRIGLYDYNGGSERLFSTLRLNNGEGSLLSDGSYILSYYELVLNKGENNSGYLTDWGIKAIIHALVYGNTDYNIDYVGFGSGYEEDITPLMTSDTEPSPYIISASSTQGSFYPWKAFDGVGGNYGWTSNVEVPAWLKIDMNTPMKINKYAIKTGNSNDRPSTWTFEGSNTGAFAGEETILDTQTSITQATLSWGYYSFVNSESFRYYRINVTAITSNLSVNIVEFKIYTSNYVASDSINGLFATTQATSILPSESNKLLTSFDYTDSGGHQVEEVGVVSMSLIPNSELTTISNSAINPSNAFDGDESTYTNFSGSMPTTYVGKYSDTYKINTIRMLITGSSGISFRIDISNDTTNGTDGTWTELLTMSNNETAITEYTVYLNGVKGFRMAGANGAPKVYEVYSYKLNLFSKFAHSKTLSDTEQWQSTITNLVRNT